MIALTGAVQSYPANEPAWPDSVLFLGDLHMGRGANATAHAATARTDLLRYSVPLLVQVGDMTENGLGAEDALALGVLASLPATAIRVVGGNHDDESLRGYPAALAAWGYNARNWSYDCGPMRVIGITPDAHPAPGGNGSDPTMTYDAAALAFLDDELEAAGDQDCWVVAHAPLQGALTNTPNWYANPSAAIKAILDARPNAKAWFSGHVHEPFTDPSICALTSVGSRSVVNANASAIAYVNPGDDAADPVRSLLATHIEGGVELRIRDHGLRRYAAWPDGSLVKTLEAT